MMMRKMMMIDCGFVAKKSVHISILHVFAPRAVSHDCNVFRSRKRLSHRKLFNCLLA